MPTEQRLKTEEETLTQGIGASQEPPTATQNVVLSLKLLAGGAALILFLWCLDSHLTN